MANEMVAVVNPYKAACKSPGLDQEKIEQFLAVVRRANVDKPKRSDLKELEKWLNDYPGLWRGLFDMAEFVQANFIKRAVEREALQLAMEHNVASLRDELGYRAAPALEKLLIEDIVLAWLHKQWLEYQLVTMMGKGEIRMSVVNFWERRLSVAENRYLSACQALAKVRRLASRVPALQVNIATDHGQQVNVAGNLDRAGADPARKKA